MKKCLIGTGLHYIFWIPEIVSEEVRMGRDTASRIAGKLRAKESQIANAKLDTSFGEFELSGLALGKLQLFDSQLWAGWNNLAGANVWYTQVHPSEFVNIHAHWGWSRHSVYLHSTKMKNLHLSVFENSNTNLFDIIPDHIRKVWSGLHKARIWEIIINHFSKNTEITTNNRNFAEPQLFRFKGTV